MFEDDTRSSSQWRASQKGHRIFMRPKSLADKESTTGRRARPNEGLLAVENININRAETENKIT